MMNDCLNWARLIKLMHNRCCCCVIAIYFLLETGCRPNEAAYLVLNNSFYRVSDVEGCDYKAIVPAHQTKTKAKYKWAMKKKANQAI